MAERRQVPRYLFGVPGKLSQSAGGAFSDVTVVTISVRGCCVEGASAPSVGQKCQLRIEWRGTQIPAEAEVAWKNKQGQAGMRFLSVEPEGRQLLRELCSTLKLQPLEPLPSEPE